MKFLVDLTPIGSMEDIADCAEGNPEGCAWLAASVIPGARGGKGIRNAIEEGATASRTAEDAFKHGYRYHPRIRQRALEDPVAHNFPYSFDDIILSSKPITQKDGSLLFRVVGALNGKDGVYEMALNPQSGVIFHRTWRSR